MGEARECSFLFGWLVFKESFRNMANKNDLAAAEIPHHIYTKNDERGCSAHSTLALGQFAFYICRNLSTQKR